MAVLVYFCLYISVYTISVQGLKLIDDSNVIDVSTFLEGDGNPWLLTQDGLEMAISNVNKTRKTLFFPAGIY